MEVINGIFNFIGMVFFIAATGISIFQFQKDRNTSNLTFFLLFLGAVLFSFGNVLDKFGLVEESVADDFAESFKIFCAVTFFFWIIIPVIESRLIESEKNLKLNQFAIDHTLIEVFWINSDGKFLYVNKAACNNLGYSYEELLTKSVPDVDPLHDINIYKQVWEELKEKGFLTFETLHQRKDGATYPVQVTTNYLEFEGEEYNFAFAIDTTKIKEAERLVLEEVKKLRELDEMREDIITRVSHELKTPLTSTYMASEIILEQYKEKLDGNLSALIQTMKKIRT